MPWGECDSLAQRPIRALRAEGASCTRHWRAPRRRQAPSQQPCGIAGITGPDPSRFGVDERLVLGAAERVTDGLIKTQLTSFLPEFGRGQGTKLCAGATEVFLQQL